MITMMLPSSVRVSPAIRCWQMATIEARGVRSLAAYRSAFWPAVGASLSGVWPTESGRSG